MDFRQLETFVKVCEEMSFTKAANNLYISQQGVSKSIKSLEDELGVPLFSRTTSSISLTKYGTIMLRYASGLVEDYVSALNAINNEKESRQDNIRVGFTQGMVNFLPDRLLEEYILSHPKTKILINEYSDAGVDEALINNEIDVGFCISPVNREKFKVHLSRSMNVYFMISDRHPFAAESSIDLRQLKNSTFITFGEHSKGHIAFLERCRKAGFIPNIGIRANDIGLMMSLCKRNLGVGIYVGDEPAQLPGLKILPDKLHSWKYTINICTLADHGITSKESEFINSFTGW